MCNWVGEKIPLRLHEHPVTESDNSRMHVSTDCLPYFSDIVIFGQICFLVLEASEPSFNHDIVSPPAFAIHALTVLVFFEEIHVLIACKLTALI